MNPLAHDPGKSIKKKNKTKQNSSLKKKGLGPLPKIINPPAHHPASLATYDLGKSIKKKKNKTQLLVVSSPTPKGESKKNQGKKKEKKKKRKEKKGK